MFYDVLKWSQSTIPTMIIVCYFMYCHYVYNMGFSTVMGVAEMDGSFHGK